METGVDSPPGNVGQYQLDIILDRITANSTDKTGDTKHIPLTYRRLGEENLYRSFPEGTFFSILCIL